MTIDSVRFCVPEVRHLLVFWLFMECSVFKLTHQMTLVRPTAIFRLVYLPTFTRWRLTSMLCFIDANIYALRA